MSGNLLEGNKDRLLNRARSDLAKRELHVESLNKCIHDLQKRTEAQNRALHDVQNEFVESRREQTRLQEELLRKVYTEYTPTACMTYKTVCSQARTDMKRVLVAQERNGSVALYHLCAPERIRHQVSHVIPLLVSSTSPLFQSTTARSTTWTARPSPRRRCTPRATSSRAPTKKLQRTQSGRKAELKNHSQILNMSVPETCAQTSSQKEKALRDTQIRSKHEMKK